MVDSNQIDQILGKAVYGSDGGKLGKVGQSISTTPRTGRSGSPSRRACSATTSPSSRWPRASSTTPA